MPSVVGYCCYFFYCSSLFSNSKCTEFGFIRVIPSRYRRLQIVILIYNHPVYRMSKERHYRIFADYPLRNKSRFLKSNVNFLINNFLFVLHPGSPLGYRGVLTRSSPTYTLTSVPSWEHIPWWYGVRDYEDLGDWRSPLTDRFRSHSPLGHSSLSSPLTWTPTR